MNRFLFVTVLLCGAAFAQADVLAQFDFSKSVDTASQVDADVKCTRLKFGKSVATPKNADNAFYKSKPVLPLARKDDTLAQVYFEFTVTAPAGSTLKLDSFTFDAAKGGASDPRSYEVHTNVGGLPISIDADHPGKVLAGGHLTAQRPASGGDGEMQTVTVDLSDPAYAKLTSLTIRVYFDTPDVSQNIDFDNLTLNGSVTKN